ncbi:MAG: hypothetical protein AB7U85_04835 [Alphaproteobacteria bacterium]
MKTFLKYYLVFSLGFQLGARLNTSFAYEAGLTSGKAIREWLGI